MKITAQSGLGKIYTYMLMQTMITYVTRDMDEGKYLYNQKCIFTSNHAASSA